MNEGACDTIFNSLVETANQKGLKEFPCIVHPDHPFARFAFWQVGEVRVRSGGGAGMAQVLNLGSLLAKIRKELERRLYFSELHRLEGSLKITSNEQFIFLEIGRGRVSVKANNIKGIYELDIPLARLNALMTGYESIRELAKNFDVKLKGGERLCVLSRSCF